MKLMILFIYLFLLQSCSFSTFTNETKNCEVKIDSLKQEIVKLQERSIEQAELARYEAEKFHELRKKLKYNGLWDQYKE